MLALAGALLAGVLTTLAPCVLPMLPVIVGGAVGGSAGPRRAVLVASGLAVSVFAFTLLLRASTVLLGIPPQVWNWVAGGLLVALGVFAVFPGLWDAVSLRLGIQARTSGALVSARGIDGPVGALLTGAALGPVFSSCSPMYGYVVVTVIPAEPGYGIALLTSYVIGMTGALLAIALIGQRLVRRLGWLADPRGAFRRVLGLVFIAVGVAVAFGWDRDLQAWIIENAPWRPWELDSGFIPDG